MNKTFTAVMQKVSTPGGWTYVVMPDAAEFFGTHGAVKVTGMVDGEPITTSFMAMGDGVQMLPIKADVRKVIGKQAGDPVTVVLTSWQR